MTKEEFCKAPKKVTIVFNRVTSNEELKRLLDMASLNVESSIMGADFSTVENGVQKSCGTPYILQQVEYAMPGNPQTRAILGNKGR
jgi:hypothetical protein